MRFIQLLALTLAACTGGEGPDPTPADAQQIQGPACTNADFDPCTDNSECDSGNCHFFNQSAFTVCVPACTPNDDSTCPIDSTGNHAQCNKMGICKPAAPNACSR